MDDGIAVLQLQYTSDYLMTHAIILAYHRTAMDY